LKRAIAIAMVAAAIAACSGNKPAPIPSDGLGGRGSMPAPDGGAPIAKADAGSSEPVDPQMSPKDAKNFARILERMSEIRGIKPTKPVPGVKLTREEMVARIKEKALREYPADALAREGHLLQLIGFAPASFEYLAQMMKLLEVQLEGFYEPNNGTMYLASDLKGKEAQATLAHEIVHALQDHKWDLKTRSTYKPGQGDVSLALAALVEGDATSAMLDYIMREQGRTSLDFPDDQLRELMLNAANGNEIKSVPHILRTTLIAPYVEGLAFVQALRRKGGWSLVDKAWDRPPKTTEQILHFKKWESDEGALQVPAPSGTALGSGWKKEDEDTFGELGFALSFEEWMDAADARLAAAGWGGDRSCVFQKGEEIALVVRTRYDPPAKAGTNSDVYAERAMSKLIPALKKLPTAKSPVSDTTSICIERSDTGPLMFARKGRDVVMIAGPAKIAATRWTSTSTCAAARKWADEVLAQK